eukprot:1159248-Pelagomonas_calceolata.AAC.2
MGSNRGMLESNTHGMGFQQRQNSQHGLQQGHVGQQGPPVVHIITCSERANADTQDKMHECLCNAHQSFISSPAVRARMQRCIRRCI